MADITITVNKEELNLIMAAMAHYRLRGFPLGRSSYSNNINLRDRQEWAALGMKTWKKLTEKGNLDKLYPPIMEGLRQEKQKGKQNEQDTQGSIRQGTGANQRCGVGLGDPSG